MNTLVMTGYTQEMAYIGDITSMVNREYAEKHGYEFWCRDHSEFDPRYYPSWSKLHFLSSCLSYYDEILWLDADTLVTNDLIDFGCMAEPNITASLDWDQTDAANFSTGNLIVRDTLRIRLLLQEAQSLEKWRDQPLWEQSALREVSAKYPGSVRVLRQRFLNSVPADIKPGAIAPWQEGDFLCHLTGTKEQRIELLPKYLARRVVVA